MNLAESQDSFKMDGYSAMDDNDSVSKSFPNYSVFVRPPSPQTYRTEIMVVASVYFVLFGVGLCGNTGVLTILCHLRHSLPAQPRSALSQDNTFIFLTALSLVDILVIFSIPISMLDMMLGNWIFGTWMCKGFWFLESLGKVMSTMVLTAMSFARFLGVRHPTSRLLKSHTRVLLLLSLLLFIAAACLSPLLVYPEAKVHHETEHTPYKAGIFVKYRAVKCRISDERFPTKLFTWFIFSIGYIVPAILMAYFYSRLVFSVWKHRRNCLGVSQIPLKRIIIHTLALTGFYFVCWTPFWLGSLFLPSEYPEDSDHFVYKMYVLHALPYINSAFNWIFYALLNTQLQRATTLSADLRRQSQCLLLYRHSVPLNSSSNPLNGNTVIHRSLPINELNQCQCNGEKKVSLDPRKLSTFGKPAP